MKKNRFISVWQAQTDHFVNPGQARQKMLEASRETPKRMHSCFKAATERPSTQLGGTGLSCSEETRPGATRAQNRLNWQQMRERIPAPLASTPMYTELFQHTPPQHIQHILENIHFLTKGGKIGKKAVASAHTAQAGSKPFGATNYSNKATMLSFPLTLSSPSIPKAGIS